MILHGSYSSLDAPIGFTRNTVSWGLRSSALGCGTWLNFHEILSSKFFRVHVGKGVHFQVIGLESCLVTFVVSLYISEIFKPDLDSIRLFLGGVVFVVFEFPSVKRMILE